MLLQPGSPFLIFFVAFFGSRPVWGSRCCLPTEIAGRHRSEAEVHDTPHTFLVQIFSSVHLFQPFKTPETVPITSQESNHGTRRTHGMTVFFFRGFFVFRG